MYKPILYWALSYLASTFTGCISISAFSSLLGIHIAIMSSIIGLIISEIKKFKLIIKKKNKKHK